MLGSLSADSNGCRPTPRSSIRPGGAGSSCPRNPALPTSARRLRRNVVKLLLEVGMTYQSMANSVASRFTKLGATVWSRSRRVRRRGRTVQIGAYGRMLEIVASSWTTMLWATATREYHAEYHFTSYVRRALTINNSVSALPRDMTDEFLAPTPVRLAEQHSRKWRT